jgi:hypothetical protein
MLRPKPFIDVAAEDELVTSLNFGLQEGVYGCAELVARVLAVYAIKFQP